MNPIAAMSEAERQQVFVVSSLKQVDDGWDEILAKQAASAVEPPAVKSVGRSRRTSTSCVRPGMCRELACRQPSFRGKVG